MNSANQDTPKTPKLRTRLTRKMKTIDAETPLPSTQKTMDKFFKQAAKNDRSIGKKPNRRHLNFENICLDSVETVDLTLETETNNIINANSKRKTNGSARKLKTNLKTPKKQLSGLERMGVINIKTSKPSYFSNIENMSNKVELKNEPLEIIPIKKMKKEKQSDESFSNNIIFPTSEPIMAIAHKQCPEYKIVEGTSFAVDAFRFGDLQGVTHYFLTHFHADHYIGLKKSFCYKLYASEITANLVKAFVGVKSEYITVIELNKPVIINDVEITAIDANHCPGAVLLAFKLPNGKCILHTGDFRASPDMESEPYFWNNQIHTIYLDTTYLTVKYLFKPQHNSIADAINCIKEFQLKHIGARILYVAGSYLIGKEKIWMKIAETFGYKVYLEKNRRKAVETIGDENMLQYLVDNPIDANIHVIPMQHMFYLKLVEYLKEYNSNFDIILGLRPSGWEYNSKPRHQGAVSLVGIEYSEHSSYYELRRIISFLQPEKIISTVPIKSNVWETMKIPDSWYNNELRPRRKNCQFSISTYMKPLLECNLNQEENTKTEMNANLSPTLSNSSKYKNIKDFELFDQSEASNDLQAIDYQIRKENTSPGKSCEIKSKIKIETVDEYNPNLTDKCLDFSNSVIKEEYDITEAIDDDWLV